MITVLVETVDDLTRVISGFSACRLSCRKAKFPYT